MKIGEERVEALARKLHELAMIWARDHSSSPEGGCLGGDECRWTAAHIAPLIEEWE